MKTLAIKFLSFILIAFARATYTSSTEIPRFCSEGDCYMSVTEVAKPWIEAQNLCKSFSSNLPIVNDAIRMRSFAAALYNLTHRLDYSHYWIGANAWDDRGVTWRWLDGSKYNGTVSTGVPWSYSRSYAYIFVNQSSVSTNSTLQINASSPITMFPYICQFRASESKVCVNETGQVTYRTANVCFVVYSLPLGWFSARNNCLEQGGDLASLHNDSFLRQNGDNLSSSTATWLPWLLSYFKTTPSTQQFWIGLRSSWWNWTDDMMGQSKDVGLTYSFWRDNQPDGNYSQCISTDYGASYWRDNDCNDSVHFICQAKDYTYSSRSSAAAYSSLHSPVISPGTTESQTAVNDSSEDRGDSVIPLAVGIGVGVGVPLLIAVIVIIVVLSIRQKRKRENTSKSHSTNAIGRDNKSKPANQHSSEGAYAFVTPQGNAAELQPAPTKHSAAAAVYEGLSFNDKPM